MFSILRKHKKKNSFRLTICLYNITPYDIIINILFICLLMRADRKTHQKDELRDTNGKERNGAGAH